MKDLPEIDYSSAPNDYGGAWRRYVENGIEPGSFGLALLRDDWEDARDRADHINAHLIELHAAWINANLPRESHGDAETVRRWIAAIKAGHSYGFVKAAFQGRVKAILRKKDILGEDYSPNDDAANDHWNK